MLRSRLALAFTSVRERSEDRGGEKERRRGGAGSFREMNPGRREGRMQDPGIKIREGGEDGIARSGVRHVFRIYISAEQTCRSISAAGGGRERGRKSRARNKSAVVCDGNPVN